MTPDEHKALARRIPEDVATDGNLDVLDEVLADDFVDHSPIGPDLHGIYEIKDQIQMFQEAFPDFTATVEDIVAEGDTVAMRVTVSGTHEGEFMGIEPTGNDFTIPNMVFTRIDDG